MRICENCHNKWSWKQMLKKTATLNPEMICPYCGEKQYQTQKSKTFTSLLSVIVLFPLLLQMNFNISLVILLSLIPILLVIVLLIYPFLIKLGSKEEFIDLTKSKQENRE